MAFETTPTEIVHTDVGSPIVPTKSLDTRESEKSLLTPSRVDEILLDPRNYSALLSEIRQIEAHLSKSPFLEQMISIALLQTISSDSPQGRARDFNLIDAAIANYEAKVRAWQPYELPFYETSKETEELKIRAYKQAKARLELAASRDELREASGAINEATKKLPANIVLERIQSFVEEGKLTTQRLKEINPTFSGTKDDFIDLLDNEISRYEAQVSAWQPYEFEQYGTTPEKEREKVQRIKQARAAFVLSEGKSNDYKSVIKDRIQKYALAGALTGVNTILSNLSELAIRASLYYTMAHSDDPVLISLLAAFEAYNWVTTATIGLPSIAGLSRYLLFTFPENFFIMLLNKKFNTELPVSVSKSAKRWPLILEGSLFILPFYEANRLIDSNVDPDIAKASKLLAGLIKETLPDL